MRTAAIGCEVSDGRPSCTRAAGSATGSVLCAAPFASEALTFSSSIQRFEADGNAYGSTDGVFDLVDEFDDGMRAPNWVRLLGTALEAGGVMTLRDPGVSVPSTGLPQEIATVESTAEVANGLGDFVLTAYWDPAALPVNRQFFLQLYGTSPVIEATGLTVSNLDAATAAGAGAPTGYSVQFSRVFPLGNQEPPVALFVPIVPAAITGPIVLRLSFDDATDLVQPRRRRHVRGTTSANGLRKVKLADNRTRNGTLKFSLVALGTSFPNDTSVPAGAAIGLGEDVCANAPLACTGSANTIKCR